MQEVLCAVLIIQIRFRGSLVEPISDHLYVVQNPPAKPLSQDEMDLVYGLPYMRTYHPSYEKDGGVPAIKEIKFSLISNRGCFGGCSFCALTFPSRKDCADEKS